MKKIIVVALSAATTSAPFYSFAQKANKLDADKPNILILLADDLGYGELGCYGQSKILTPNIDSLAASGMMFNNFYAGSTVSSPSRASLLTGLHSGHVSIRGNSAYYPDGKWDRIALKKTETTFGEMLQNAGYYTGMIGKWHLDLPCDKSTWAHNRGFDYAVQPQWGSPSCNAEFESEYFWVNGEKDSVRYDFKENDCIDSFRWRYVGDFFSRRDSERPFCLFMSYRSVHATERNIRDTSMYSDKGWPEIERRHAARITMLDTEIGKMLDMLKASGALENTLVIFLSDNGAHIEGGHNSDFFNSTSGLRGVKRDLYEGGIRVPAIFSWKGKIARKSISEHIAAFWDIMPTLAELTEAKAPLNDGISLLPELIAQKQIPHKYLYWEFQLDGAWHPQVKIDGGFRQAMRMGDWKYVKYGNSAAELYNLKDDPFEKNDVANQNISIVTKMRKHIDKSHTNNYLFPYGGIIGDVMQ